MQCFLLSTCHFLYAIDARLKLQPRHCQMKRIGKLPHGSGRGGKIKLWWVYSNMFKRLPLSIIDCHLVLLPLARQPIVGFGLSNNVLPFFPICHQLSPSSHPQHLKISFYFLFPSFPGSSPSSRPFQFLSEDLFGHPILLNSL